MNLSRFLLLFFILAGCAGKPAQPANPAVPAPAPPVPGAAAQPPAAPPPPPKAPQPTATVRPFDESILRGKEYLLEIQTPATVTAQDQDLGPLGTDKDLTGVITKFFDQTAAGTLDEGVLVPRWAPYLQGWATKAKAAGWEKGQVRTGVAEEDKRDGRMVPVRVIQEKKNFEGWVYLVKDDDKYLVSDVQVSESAKAAGPFDPESADQEISRPNRR